MSLLFPPLGRWCVRAVKREAKVAPTLLVFSLDTHELDTRTQHKIAQPLRWKHTFFSCANTTLLFVSCSILFQCCMIFRVRRHSIPWLIRLRLVSDATHPCDQVGPRSPKRRISWLQWKTKSKLECCSSTLFYIRKTLECKSIKSRYTRRNPRSFALVHSLFARWWNTRKRHFSLP